MRSLKSHQSARSKSSVWLTPQWITKDLGEFDLDPCSLDEHPWQIAKSWFTEDQDGLSKMWFGRIWLNPPFSDEKWKWMERLALWGNGIALIPACTETKGFVRTVWNRATAVCFIEGRPHFHHADGTRGRTNSGAPIVLVAYGDQNGCILKSAGLGKFFWI